MFLILLVSKTEVRDHLSAELFETVVELLCGLVEEDVGAVAETEDGKFGVCEQVVRQAFIGHRLPEVAAVGRELALAARCHDAEDLFLLGDLVEINVIHCETLGTNAAAFELVCPDLQQIALITNTSRLYGYEHTGTISFRRTNGSIQQAVVAYLSKGSFVQHFKNSLALPLTCTKFIKVD